MDINLVSDFRTLVVIGRKLSFQFIYFLYVTELPSSSKSLTARPVANSQHWNGLSISVVWVSALYLAPLTPLQPELYLKWFVSCPGFPRKSRCSVELNTGCDDTEFAR